MGSGPTFSVVCQDDKTINQLVSDVSFPLINIHVGYQMLSAGILIVEYYSEI